jgi:hypothetical protein
MDQPPIMADPYSLDKDLEPIYLGFDTISYHIQTVIEMFVPSTAPELRKRMAEEVMLKLADNGWAFYNRNWPGFNESEGCNGSAIQAASPVQTDKRDT